MEIITILSIVVFNILNFICVYTLCSGLIKAKNLKNTSEFIACLFCGWFALFYYGFLPNNYDYKKQDNLIDNKTEEKKIIKNNNSLNSQENNDDYRGIVLVIIGCLVVGGILFGYTHNIL